MLKKILVALVAIAAGLCGYAAIQPSEYTVARSATINAPPEAVFPLVNDFHNWDKWSPWEKMDPAMKKEFTGPDAGAGAKYAWSGNDQVGEGSMTLRESQPVSRIAIALEFKKPWESSAINEFQFTPEGSATKVTWSMRGNNDFMAKLFTMFMNMDKMIGDDFEKGLTDMKRVAEGK